MNQGRLQKSLVVSALGAALAGFGTAALASGFQLQEQNASGLGLAYSGMAAAVQDASTVFWNPAGQALLPGVQGAVSLNYVDPSIKYQDGPSPPPAVSNFNPLAGNGGQGGQNALVPALYGSWMINPQWSVGLGINAPFGLETEWDSPWQGQFHAIKSKIETFNINPTVAFKVNNAIQLGAGIGYQRLKATLTQASNLAGTGIVQVDGDDWAWGWNVGALFALGPDTRIGLTYRSTMRYTVDANLTVSGVPIVTPVKADIELPDTFSVGVSHQLNQKIRLLADWTWTGWSSIQQLSINSAVTGTPVAPPTNLSFQNSWRVGGGIEYEVSQPLLLRGGLAYDTSPVQDQFRTPRLPDNDRIWLSVGARYKPSPNWWLDFGYSYIWVHDAPSQLMPTAFPAGGGNLVGTYTSHINIVGVQASFKF
jgi:long-chain fatty acid transport protein